MLTNQLFVGSGHRVEVRSSRRKVGPLDCSNQIPALGNNGKPGKTGHFRKMVERQMSQARHRHGLASRKKLRNRLAGVHTLLLQLSCAFGPCRGVGRLGPGWSLAANRGGEQENECDSNHCVFIPYPARKTQVDATIS